jgi:hypothetical protein
LNSLDDLRYAIFENTVSGAKIGEDPDSATFNELITDKDKARKLGNIVEWGAAFFNRKGISDLISKSAFLMVRRQIICLDDLERAGSMLGAREVLGLTSQLKEERKCKIILLLNDEEHDDKSEFERQLEKVADITLVFDLSPTEAVAIALTDDSQTAKLLRPRIVALGITNIRVIKKIERLAVRLVELLKDREPQIIDGAVTTLAVAGWAVHQPKLAPTTAFLRTYSRISISMRSGREKVDEETARFRALIEDYPFHGTNALDSLIIDGAEAGYFIEKEIVAIADQITRERSESSADAQFTAIWENLYHGSLVTDDNEFLDSLVAASMAEARAISSLNINGTVLLLRECGRDNDAEIVIQRFVEVNRDRGVEFFNIANHHFIRSDELDLGLRHAFEQQRSTHVDSRNPLDVARDIGARRSWSDADALLLAKLSVEDFVEVFEGLRGDELQHAVQMILAVGRSNAEGHESVRETSTQALRQIAGKSKLRARKVRAFGVDLNDDLEKAPEVVAVETGDAENSVRSEMGD